MITLCNYCKFSFQKKEKKILMLFTQAKETDANKPSNFICRSGGNQSLSLNQNSFSMWQTIHDKRDTCHGIRRDIGQLPRHPVQHTESHVKSTDSRANGIFLRLHHNFLNDNTNHIFVSH